MNTETLANIPSTSTDFLQKLKGHGLSEYGAQLEAERLAKEALDPGPSQDDQFDDELGWEYVARYTAYGIPRTLSDRIARIRKEIKEQRAFGFDHLQVHERWWLTNMIQLVERHDALTRWIDAHRDDTIVCLSDDPTDLDSYLFLPWSDVAERIKPECKGNVSFFDDPTMWEFAAGCRGSDRYYLAFDTKSDAELVAGKHEY